MLCVPYLVLSATLVFPAHAQVSAQLSGLVTDPSGAAISGAAITVKNTGTGAVRTVSTDTSGRYQVPSLPVGEYEIRAKAPKFQEAVRTGVQLAVGQDATVDLHLAIGEASQQVTVEANASLVSVSTADISGLVGETQVQDLPLNGRSYDELMTLNPGVVNFTWEKTGGIGVSNSTSGNNFAVSGNRPQQNLFLLNGVEFTGAAENNMQPGGTSQQLLGVDAVREFNLLRDSYGAEYGKHPGAQVLIVTQSGTNQLHGSLYEFLRNNDSGCAQFLRRRLRSRLSAQSVRRRARRPDQEGQDVRVRQFRRLPAASAPDRRRPGSRRQRARRLPAVQAGDARAEPVPCVRPGRSWAFRR